MLLIERRVLLLKSLSVESVVLWLFGDGRDQVVLLGDVDSLLDLCGRPLAGSPVVGKVHVDSLREGLDDLLHRHAGQSLAQVH
jgi:hypothetical protein